MPVRNVKHGTMSLDQVTDRVAAICLVGQHDGTTREIVEQDISSTATGDVSTDQQEAARMPSPSVSVSSLMLRPPRLIPIAWAGIPFFAPPVERDAFICVQLSRTSAGGPPAAQRTYRADDFRLTSHEPIVGRLPRTVAGPCIHPGAAQSHYAIDATNHQTVTDPRNSSNLVGQQRPTPLDLLFAKLELAQIHAPPVDEPELYSSYQGNPGYGT